MQYDELHAHSNFSLLDGASFPEQMVEAARAKGMRALALTDHDGLYCVPQFCASAKGAGLKSVVGAELTLDHDFHVTLLAKDKRGYSNLRRLITRAQLSGSKGQPRWVLPTEYLRLEAELLEALFAVVEDEPVEKDLPRRGAEECVVALFGDIHAYHQVLCRSANLTPQLTKHLKSATIVLVH